jgi:cation transport ATPase
MIDESNMTGESLPVRKYDEDPFLLSGCQVSSKQIIEISNTFSSLSNHP